MFRGEILGLTGSADFYATNVKRLKSEFKKSLSVYLEECEKSGQEPYRNYSGKFILRMPEDLHKKLSMIAVNEGKSLNESIVKMLEKTSKM